ncbi:uncharacterized protein LOC120307830 isoform X2 [Crotalus tigris]|nr:uncharacterized protein LOC120307830 isoform X2 [Crotalus tigris]
MKPPPSLLGDDGLANRARMCRVLPHYTLFQQRLPLAPPTVRSGSPEVQARAVFSSLEAAPQARQRSPGFHQRRERSISVAGSEEKKKRQRPLPSLFFFFPLLLHASVTHPLRSLLSFSQFSASPGGLPGFFFLEATLRLLRKPSASEGPGHVFTGNRSGPETLTSHTAQLQRAGDTCCSPSFGRHARRSLPLALQSEFRPQQLALYQAEGAQNPANQSPSLSFGYQKNDRRRQAPSHTSWAASRQLKKASLR